MNDESRATERATRNTATATNAPTIVAGIRAHIKRVRPSALTLWSIALALVAFVLSWHLLRTTSLWYDESISGSLAQLPTDVFWSVIWQKDINMVGYYVVLRDWVGVVHLVGGAPSEVWLRLPSVLFTMGSVVAVLHVGWRFWSRTVGVVAATAFALSGLVLYDAQQARSYALYVFVLALGWFALMHVLSTVALTASSGIARTYWLWWLAYVVMMALAIYTQLMGAFVVAAQVVAFAMLLVVPTEWRSAARKAWRPFALSLLGIFLLITPILLNLVEHGKNAASLWLPPATPTSLAAFIFELANFSVLVLLLMLAGVAFSLLSARSLRLLGPVLMLLCGFAVPVLLAYALTQPGLNLHVFWDRYLSSAVMPLCLLTAAGLVAAARYFRKHRQRTVATVTLAVLLCGALAIQLPQTYYRNTVVRATWRDPAEWIEARYQQTDGIICLPRDWCSFPLEYYLNYVLAGTGQAHLDADSPGLVDWASGSAVPDAVPDIAAYSDEHKNSRIFLVVATNGPSAYNGLIREHLAWLTTHRQLVSTRHSLTVTVYLFSPPTG